MLLCVCCSAALLKPFGAPDTALAPPALAAAPRFAASSFARSTAAASWRELRCGSAAASVAGALSSKRLRRFLGRGAAPAGSPPALRLFTSTSAMPSCVGASTRSCGGPRNFAEWDSEASKFN
eukprot:scaffold52_cov246-Pinguiococcus_pyrenoidosus.AAC.11